VVVVIVVVVGNRRIYDWYKEHEPVFLITRTARVARSRMAGLPDYGFLWERAPQLDFRDAVPEGTTLILQDDQVPPEFHVCQPRPGFILICRVESDDPTS
jgi:hypothetical protein